MSWPPVSLRSWAGRERAARCVGLVAALLLLCVPADGTAQVLVRSSLSMDEEASPGGTYQGTIELYNEDDTLRSAEVSLRDYLFTGEGETEYADPGSHERSNAEWVDYESSVVSVPPQEEAEVQFEVQVPEDIDGAEPTGTYWSMLMVRPLGQGTGPSPDQGVAVRQIRRYGIQVATHLPGGEPTLEVQSTEVTEEGDESTLEVGLENTGTRMANTRLRLELYDDAGELVRDEEASSRRLYPGTSAQYQLPLSGVEAGDYEALLILNPDPGETRGVQYTLEL